MELKFVDRTYHRGMKFRSRDRYYSGKVMICHVSADEAQLICEDGERWTDRGRIAAPSLGEFRIPDDSPFWGSSGRKGWDLIEEDE